MAEFKDEFCYGWDEVAQSWLREEIERCLVETLLPAAADKLAPRVPTVYVVVPPALRTITFPISLEDAPHG